MEDEIQKRNTDCVYFLASPLTCKKGIECEYRHSDSARLNPRDCWYWLSGNCLNPTCAFRHPPLEAHTEVLSDPTPSLHQSSVPVNKTSVPCYFYFSGYCNKGDRCSFLHGPPNGANSGTKSTKSTGVVADVHHIENKTSTGSDAGAASIVTLPNPSEITSKPALSIQSGHDNQESVPNTVVERSPSPEISVPECEEVRIKSENPLPTEDFIEGGSPSCQEQSSEEHAAAGPIVPEEWWESSPGFDVLVDDGSENLGYEDDPEYLLAPDGDARELHNHLLQYDYEDPAAYDPMEYTDAGNLYKHGHYESYEHLESDDISDYIHRGSDHSRMVDPILFPKRKFLPRDPEIDGKNSVDLRDRLRKRRRMDSRLMSRNPRRHGSAHLNDRMRERPGRHGMADPLHGRLASEVGKNTIGSHGDKVAGPNDNHRGRFTHSQLRQNRSRHRERERRRQGRPEFLPSEVSRGTAPRDRRHMQESSEFSGPKTLDQIREEKRKARENKNGFGSTARSKRTSSVDFQGPKPLSEILKDKRKHWSEDDENSSSRSRHGNGEPGKGHDYINKDENFVDEDDEDDDGLEKKLAAIFS
ncbi:zinc finger CCCH domain-containing protein 34-like [Macadamia integrifolia]|uniref:zinc finger CCCH domain-containing protein 34-like n=1 Tax=Macadamia integrifolia TaxID=60698 RepID=UPI001C4F4B0C|nr:zinc finger CCCH domain-containing protein 34-like [Macadamia integrifolia]